MRRLATGLTLAGVVLEAVAIALFVSRGWGAPAFAASALGYPLLFAGATLWVIAIARRDRRS